MEPIVVKRRDRVDALYMNTDALRDRIMFTHRTRSSWDRSAVIELFPAFGTIDRRVCADAALSDAERPLLKISSIRKMSVSKALRCIEAFQSYRQVAS